MNILFKCPTCGSFCKNEFTTLKDFHISAYDENIVEWSESENDIPEMYNGHWSHPTNIPKVGEHIVVCLHHLFYGKTSSEFWSLFMSGSSFSEGWEDYPEELNNSGFVKFKIVETLELNENHGWFKVIILDRICLNEVTKRVPIKNETETIINNAYKFDNYELLHYEDWLYLSGSAQGDLGNWMLLKQMDNDTRLIAFGEWGFHYGSAYLGNITLKKSTYKTLLEWCKNA